MPTRVYQSQSSTSLLHPSPPHCKRALLCSLVRIQTQKADKVQRKEPHDLVSEPSVATQHPLQAAHNPTVATAHRPGRRLGRPQSVAFGLEVCATGSGTGCGVGNGLAHGSGKSGGVGAADGFGNGARL